MENSKTNVIAFACQKGGVGKSCCSENVAYALSKLGKKVLLIDSDPQATTSFLCGVDIDDVTIEGLADLYDEIVYYYKQKKDRKPNEPETEFDADLIPRCIIRPKYTIVNTKGKITASEEEFGFDLIPANITLADYDHHLSQLIISGKNYGVYMLTEIINRIKELYDYDYIIIDVLPGLNMIAYNALAACAPDGGVVAVINLDPSAIIGGQNLFKTIAEIQELLWNKNHIKHNGILGVLKNEYNPRLKTSQEIESQFEEKFGPAKIFNTSIPTKASCDKAHSKKRAYAEFDPVVGEIFKKLAIEIMEECEQRNQDKEPHIIEKVGKEYYDSISQSAEGSNNV